MISNLFRISAVFFAATAFILLYPHSGFAAKTRTFEVDYTVEVPSLPGGAREVRVWIPYPSSNEDQRILSINVESPAPYEVNYDTEWGNGMVYFRLVPVGGFTFTMRFVVERRERVVDPTGNPGDRPEGKMDVRLFKRFLMPSAYAVHNERVERLSRMAVKGKTGYAEKARDIYDFTLENMEYSKKVPGWGKGDVDRICLAIGEGKQGTGNCTDFHSFFGSLMRFQSIPVLFEMGFPLTPGKDSVEPIKGGYHCWAKFYVPGIGWVPVDISEADKDPSKKDYFFGAVCENRFSLSRGRDILLVPPQRGARLNFFGPDPYIEVDGESFTGFTRTISYRDVK
ncbi:MAG: transglutaminase domain-containing protein [Thermodesulfobacteriota bacterium]